MRMSRDIVCGSGNWIVIFLMILECEWHLWGLCVVVVVDICGLLNCVGRTEIYTSLFVGSVRCV